MWGWGYTYIQHGQPSVHETCHDIAQESDAQEDQKDLVGLSGKDVFPGTCLKNVDAGNQEQGRAEVHGECDGHIAHDVGPAANPACNPAPRRRCQHKCLIVHATCGWIDAGDFAQRHGHAEDDGGYSNPTPDDVGRTTTDQGVVHCRAKTIRDSSKDEGHEGDLQSRSISCHFGGISEGFEKLVGRYDLAARWCAGRIKAVLVCQAYLGLMVAEAGAMILRHNDTRHLIRHISFLHAASVVGRTWRLWRVLTSLCRGSLAKEGWG